MSSMSGVVSVRMKDVHAKTEQTETQTCQDAQNMRAESQPRPSEPGLDESAKLKLLAWGPLETLPKQLRYFQLLA